MKKGISTKKIPKLFVIFLILDHNLLSFSGFFFLLPFVLQIDFITNQRPLPP